IGAAADKAVLVHIARLAVEILRNGRGEGDQIAHPVDACTRLEARSIEVDESLVAEVERHLALQRQRPFHVWPKAQPWSVDAVAPALLGSDPCAKLAGTDLG